MRGRGREARPMLLPPDRSAFDRLLALFPDLDAEGKNKVRSRLLDYFEIVGVDDPRVAKARARLTSLLY